MLRAIGELQSGLGGLRALQEQTVKLGEELAKKRAAMAAEHTRLAALREQCAAERAEVDSLRQALDAGRAELTARQQEIETAGRQLEALRRQTETQRREAAEAGAAAHSRDAKADSLAAELRKRIADLEGTLEAEAEAFTAKLTEAAAAKASLEARIAALETDLEHAHSRSASGGGEGGGGDGGGPEIANLRDQLALVQQSRDELEAQLASGAGAAADAMAWNARRKERLHRYKSLLQSQARKIVTAKDALAKRQAECEQMLAQRAKLQTAVEAVREAEKRIASRTARTGAAATVFFALGSLALIAIMSWAVVNHIVPATYLAAAVLEPDGRGVALRSTDLESWQNYHIDLATDPGMMEEAAARFRQRGILSLGSAPELRARLNRDMAVQAREDGGIIVELQGRGSEKTARELDTFVTALASVANAGRTSRPDGAATVISAPAATGNEPVEDPRLVYAGGAAGGGILAAAVLGLVVWGRLSKAKRRYEEEQALSNALEELSWAGPPDGR